MIACGLFWVPFADLTFLCFLWYLEGIWYTPRKENTLEKAKQEPSYLLTQKKKCSQSEDIPECGSAAPDLRLGPTQSTLFQPSVDGRRLPQQWLTRSFFFCFFKLQFITGNNILYCDPVHTVYKLGNISANNI